jgi:transposase
MGRGDLTSAEWERLRPLLPAESGQRGGRWRDHRQVVNGADKAYSSRANRAGLRARKVPHAIPERDDQRAHRRARGRAGDRPPGFDPLRYARRNQVERGFNRRKQLRAVATRYDKLECRYQATLTVASILDWLRAMPDRDPGTRLRASG